MQLSEAPILGLQGLFILNSKVWRNSVPQNDRCDRDIVTVKYVVKLVKKFILLSIPLILISVYTGLNMMGCLSVEYPMWAEEKDYVNQPSGEGESPEILIIGDSRAKSGIIPGMIREDGSVYNIAIGGATGLEMYYAVRNYLKSHEAPEQAIVIFAPYHFCEMDNWGQTLYYDYLTIPELMEAEKEGFKHRDKSLHYQGWISDLISFKLRLPNKYLDAVYTSRFGGNLSKNLEKYDSVRKDFGYTVFGEAEETHDLNYETHHPEFDLSPTMDSYYIKLLDLLNSNGVRVTIAQAPVNASSEEVITEEFKEGFSGYMEKISERYPEFTVEKEMPVYDDSFFGDNNHLNRRGAEKYTAEFVMRYHIDKNGGSV